MNHRVMYLRDSYTVVDGKLNPGAPVGCVVIKVNHKQNSASYHLSVQNPQDKFDREVARSLALGRLAETPFVVDIPTNHNMHDITAAVMRDIAIGGWPSRAVRAAKLWLRTNSAY